MSSRQTWLLVDGTGMAHKIFKVRKTAIASESHVMTWLHILRSQIKADRCCIAWDGDDRESNWRVAICPDYKAHREEKEPQLIEFLEKMRTARIHGYESFTVHGCEADDILATLAFKANMKSYRAIIVSSDADMHQCLHPGAINQLKKFKTFRGELQDCEWVTYDSFMKKYGGVNPAQWPMWKAIVGDTDIEGLRDLGDAAATKILNKYVTVEDAANDQWGLPLDDQQRVTFMNAWNSGRLQALCKVHRLKRDLDIQ